jgi:hypothetical protein
MTWICCGGAAASSTGVGTGGAAYNPNSMTFAYYTGTDTQGADPSQQADAAPTINSNGTSVPSVTFPGGIGTVPAYRGIVYITFVGLKLTATTTGNQNTPQPLPYSNAIPNVEAEFATLATSAEPTIQFDSGAAIVPGSVFNVNLILPRAYTVDSSGDLRVLDTTSGDLVATVTGVDSGLFPQADANSVLFTANGGNILMLDALTGAQIKSFVPVPPS